MNNTLHQMMRELLERSVRTETRLVRLMQAHGLDPEGYPITAPTQLTSPEKADGTHDDRNANRPSLALPIHAGGQVANRVGSVARRYD